MKNILKPEKLENKIKEINPFVYQIGNTTNPYQEKSFSSEFKNKVI